MQRVLVATEQFFWTAIWIFLILIVGFFLLGLISNKFGGNFLGSLSSWISSHAQPQ